MTDHAEIWLEPADCADHSVGRQWCAENIGSEDADGNRVDWRRYVRADLRRPTPAAEEQVVEAMMIAGLPFFDDGEIQDCMTAALAAARALGVVVPETASGDTQPGLSVADAGQEPDAWLLVTEDGKRYCSCGEAFHTTKYATAYPLFAGDALAPGGQDGE